MTRVVITHYRYKRPPRNDAPETPHYEATTAHFRAVIARKLRK